MKYGNFISHMAELCCAFIGYFVQALLNLSIPLLTMANYT